ncbi:MAG: flavodoxin family protein [Thermodesulfobacteriota bacterium]
MTVLAINGSPRRGGNTETLLHAFLGGAEKVEVIRVVDLRIQPCIGCGGCDRNGECVLEDDMQEMHAKLLAARRIVLASPIYFYGITAQAKALVDRCQALWSRKRLMAERGEWRDDPDRQGYLLSVAASHGARVFDGAMLTARYAFDAIGVAYAGEFLARGIDARGRMAEESELLARARRAGADFLAGGGRQSGMVLNK